MKTSNYPRVACLFAGVLILTLGCSYYLLFRPASPVFVQTIRELFPLTSAVPNRLPADSINNLNWLPTFLHVLGMSSLSVGVIRPNRRRIIFITGFWVGVNVVFEFGQLSIVPGTFDVWDLIAALSAGFFAVVALENLFSARVDCSVSATRKRITRFYRIRTVRVILSCALVAGFGIISIGGSYHACTESHSSSDINGSGSCQRFYDAEPVYMSYDELRNSAIYTDQNVPLTESGKIYLYQNYLLVNTPNQGIHVYDNTDKQNPVHLTFVNIPGNLDIAIRQNNLYVDSYVDLVVLDISDIANIREIHRVIDVFPYNIYQNVPPTIYLGPVDRGKGVVVGYKEVN